jgi:hypothetical protein
VPRKEKRVKAVTAPAAVADDFKHIKGIGPAIEQRLHGVGILTYADLAKLTPAQISERTGGLSAKVVDKKRWIKQAAKLASESAGRPLRRARFRVDLMLDDNDRVQSTRVKHIRHEQDEAERNKWDAGWGYWSEERLIDFFVQHARIRPQPIRAPISAARTESTIEKKSVHTENLVALPLETAAPVEQSVERTPEVMEAYDSLQPQMPLQRPAEMPAQVSPVAISVEPSPELQLAATNMQVLEFPLQSQINDSPFSKRLRAQFSFQLSGAKANEITVAQLSYFVQILACELSTGHTTILATDTQMLQPGSMLYTLVADFALPAVGRYQTLGVIFLSIPDDSSIPARARVDVAWGPILKIIP